MAGVNLESGKGGGRRSLDSQINMVPMIDLLLVTISFLLLTAVWTHTPRLEANAQVPGKRDAPPCASEPLGCPNEKVLHVDMSKPESFILDWREGTTVVRSSTVPRNAGGRAGDDGRALSLGEALRGEWAALGAHKAGTDSAFDHAVVHTDNGARYAEIVAVLDALGSVRRPLATGVGARTRDVPAFNVALAEN